MCVCMALCVCVCVCVCVVCLVCIFVVCVGEGEREVRTVCCKAVIHSAGLLAGMWEFPSFQVESEVGTTGEGVLREQLLACGVSPDWWSHSECVGEVSGGGVLGGCEGREGVGVRWVVGWRGNWVVTKGECMEW